MATSVTKTTYSKEMLLHIRDVLFPSSLPRHEGTPSTLAALPVFGAPDANPGLGDSGTGAHGSWREGMFGGSSRDGKQPVRRTSSLALSQSASASDLAGSSAGTAVLWVYRTKGGTNKSNPMSLKDIEQLVADELVEADEIELCPSIGGVGEGVFRSLSEALAAPSVVLETPTAAAGGERWRPGGSQRLARPTPQLSGRGVPSNGSQATSAVNHTHLPSKHLNISRDDMLAAEELRRRSPCAASPPSPAAASMNLPAPIDIIDEGSLLDGADLGLGTVPTPMASSLPQPPAALGGDPTLTLSPAVQRVRPPVSQDGSPSKRGPPPPISCVDNLPVAPPPAFAIEPEAPSVSSHVVESPPPVIEENTVQPSEVMAEDASKARRKGKGNETKKISEALSQLVEATVEKPPTPAPSSDKAETTGRGRGRKAPDAVVEHANATDKDQHVDPVTVAPEQPKNAPKGQRAHPPSTQAGGNANAWSANEAAGKKSTGKQNKERRSATASNTVSPVQPSVDTALYPTLEEVLSGTVPAKAPVKREVQTLASIVAASSSPKSTAVPSSSATAKPSAATPTSTTKQTDAKKGATKGRSK